MRDINKGSCSIWMVFKALGLDKATSERSLERRGDDRRGGERGGEGKTGKRNKQRLFRN